MKDDWGRESILKKGEKPVWSGERENQNKKRDG